MVPTASQALARKWRPTTFDALVGQEHVVQALSHALRTQRLHHAYLFTGTRGVGKTTVARILARALNCEQGIGPNPCGQCRSCQDILQQRFVDLLEVDAATNTRVDEMRTLLENAMYAPTAGRYKVYVIDEVHMLSNSAFNAMLKTLEEPPPHVLFILATTDPQKIPATVLSRCLQFGLRPLSPEHLAQHLATVLQAESVQYEDAALYALAKAAQGSVRDALSLTDQAIVYSGGRITQEAVQALLGQANDAAVPAILKALADQDGPALLQLADQLAAQLCPLATVLDNLAAAAFRLSVLQVGGALNPNNPEEAALQPFASVFSAEDLQLFYQMATHARAELPLAPSEAMGFGMALLRMLAFRPYGVSLAAGSSGAVPTPIPAPAAGPLAAATPVAAPPAAPVPAAPANAPLAPATPVPLPSHAQDWPALVEGIAASGLTRQALVQTEWVQGQAQENTLHIVLRTAIKAYTEPGSVERMQKALSAHFGLPVRLNLQLGQAERTAHAVHSSQRQEALQNAKADLQNDPMVQALQQQLGASIVPGSERALGPEGPRDI